MPKTKLKICGITNLDDALFCAENGADALGFVLYEKSPRYIDIKQSVEIIRHLPPFVCAVAVSVNPDDELTKKIEDAGFNLLQLHGGKVKTRLRIIRALSYQMISQYRSGEYILIDSSKIGGTGKSFNWEILKTIPANRLIVSGGLNSKNIFTLLKITKPYAVDLSSSLEASPGIKDHSKVKEFIEAFQQARGESL